VQIRYRALKSKFNAREYWMTVRETTTDLQIGETLKVGGRAAAPALLGATMLKTGSGIGALVTGYANAPKDVESDEQVASANEVLAMLKTGKLSTRDLVDAGEGWQTFAEHPLFCDLCDELTQREARRTRWIWAGVAVAATLALLTLLAR
jgi:hypothetical protein